MEKYLKLEWNSAGRLLLVHLDLKANRKFTLYCFCLVVVVVVVRWMKGGQEGVLFGSTSCVALCSSVCSLKY